MSASKHVSFCIDCGKITPNDRLLKHRCFICYNNLVIKEGKPHRCPNGYRKIGNSIFKVTAPELICILPDVKKNANVAALKNKARRKG